MTQLSLSNLKVAIYYSTQIQTYMNQQVLTALNIRIIKNHLTDISIFLTQYIFLSA